ncbi:two component transcriptional regulator, LytTR family [Bacteroidales bacterium 6E]|nr:two component transcriptional regulator, LytTR family [Bacteroidales bacterium 6E]
MKILIVEDEQPAADRMVRLLRSTGRPLEICGVLPGIEQTVNWMMTHPDPDLIIMDIRLEDGLCFEIFETVQVQVPVIFTTAYDSYAIRAFKVNSVDYLLKPVSEEELGMALDKFDRLYMINKAYNFVWEQVKKDFAPTMKERFLVKIANKFRSIPASEIALFYSEDHTTFLYTQEGKSYDIEFPIQKLEEMLSPSQFFRINRSQIIGFKAISEVVTLSGTKLKVILKDGLRQGDCIVSRERMNQFKQWMNR